MQTKVGDGQICDGWRKSPWLGVKGLLTTYGQGYFFDLARIRLWEMCVLKNEACAM